MQYKADVCNFLDFSHETSQELHLLKRTAFVFMIAWYCLFCFNGRVESWDVWVTKLCSLYLLSLLQYFVFHSCYRKGCLFLSGMFWLCV